MRKKIRFGIIGGGSIFTPELIDLISDEMEIFHDVEITFMDICKSRMDITCGLSERILSKKGVSIPVRYTDRYEEAIENADFILLQFRVGGEDARIDDELIGKCFRIPFVETVSVCGIATFLRTYFELEKIAMIIKEKAPDAWVLNFANPAGLVAEALSKLGIRNVIGVCNASTRLFQFLKKKLGYDNDDDCFMTWRGLNHLTVVDSIVLQGKEVLPELIDSLEDFESDRVPFEKELIKQIGFLPNQYFQYYFRRQAMVDKLQAQEKVRSELVKEINHDLLNEYRNIDSVPEKLKQRGGSGYSKTVVSAIRSLITGDNKIHYLVTENKGAIPQLPYSAYVECPCVVGNNLVLPVACGNLPAAAEPLIVSMKQFEELLIEAAMDRNRKLLYQSMMVHPLIGDHSLACNLIDSIMNHNSGYLPKEF